jgi:hypothetical protein
MTARITARALAALASLALVIAACGNGAATTAPTQATGTTAPATQVPATQGAAATGGPSVDPLASFHGAQSLEALLPDQVGGVSVVKASIGGTDFMANLGASDELRNALTALGKSPADLSVAFASAGTTTLFAFQVNGVAGSQILSAMIAQQAPGSTSTDVSFGGKSVKKISTTDDSTVSYVYTSQDVVFVVAGDDVTDAILNEVFSKLP